MKSILLAGALLPVILFAAPKEDQVPPGYTAVRQPDYLLLTPPGPVKGKAPLLIHLYGAGGSRDFFNLGSQPFAEIRNELAARRYYILIPELGPRHWMGRETRAKLDRIVDQILATYPIQKKRIYLLGTSMGGGSTLAYAIHRPKMFRALVVHMGMTDFRQWYEEAPRYRKQLAETYGGTPQQAPAAWSEVSAMANLDLLRKIPIFLVYAADDKVVLPSQGQQLYDALRARHGKVTLRIAPGVAHKNESMTPFAAEVIRFLDHP